MTGFSRGQCVPMPYYGLGQFIHLGILWPEGYELA